MPLRNALVLGLLLIGALPADTIITRTGPVPLPFVTGAEYVSWTQTGTFSNVTIQVNLVSNDGTATGNVYLTTQIGPGTTVAQQVATVAVSTSNIAASGIATTVFSGLTLGPGTYYVTVSGANLGIAFSETAVTVVGTGVTANHDGAGTADPFPPASTFSNKGQILLFSAAGAAGAGGPATIPTLSPFAMLLTALMLVTTGLAMLKFYRPQE